MTLLFILVLVIVFLLLLLSMVWPPDSPWSPWWRTKDHEIRKSLKLANVTKKDIVYDLGSGDGRVLIIAAKEFGAHGVGVEIDPLRAFVSRLLVRWFGVSDRVRIVRSNFFNENLSKATVIFLYLVPKTLARLKVKLLSELPKGARIVTIQYEIDLPRVAQDSKNKIFLYRV